jgi:3-oxoacyl-[acyl-carrier protein] reductase
MPSLSLEGKVAIVTGAAGERGIGWAIALVFAEAGADVAICDNVVDLYDRNLGARAEEITRFGQRSLAIQADVSKKSDVDNMVQKVEGELGPVDILVNNAAIIGAGRSMKAFDATEEEWDECMAVDFKSHYLCSMAVGKGMMERKTGNIINIDSVEALRAGGSASPYAIAKAGVQFLTRVHARQLGQYNVRVNSICVGGVETDMGLHMRYERGITERPAELDNPERKQFGPQFEERVPLGRAAEPSEMANIALFLASDLASYVTGAIILADGGLTA